MPILLACSGPNPLAAISQHIRISLALAGVAALLLVISLVLRSLATDVHGAYVAASAALLGFHPAWWISATHGDCGNTKAGLSLIVGMVAVAVVAAQASATVRARRRARAPSKQAPSTWTSPWEV